jgi:hypothetical protein
MDKEAAFEIVHRVQDREPKPEAVHGHLSLKGTDLCMQEECTCGESSHVDGMFVWTWRCDCGKQYAVGQRIALIELTPEEGKAFDVAYGVR